MVEAYPRAHLKARVGVVEDLPELGGKEYCVLGRSNVGKSSFINHVFGDRSLAKVSRTPGKTTLANIYALDDGTFWIDLPGYGYAVASHAEQRRMSALVRHYCTVRPGVRGVLWLVDIRHPGLAIDREAWEWLSSLGLATLIVLSKADTVSPSQARRLVCEHRRFYGDTAQTIYSIRRPGMREQFWRVYRQWTASTEHNPTGRGHE